MNFPLLKGRSSNASTTAAGPDDDGGLEDHYEKSRQAQRRADKWMIVGSILMGMWAPGIFGFPIFIRGVLLQRQALRAGLAVRPLIVTVIG